MLHVAAAARDTAVSDPQRARKIARNSYIVASVGIVVSIVVFSLAFGLIYGACVGRYKYDGICYNHKESHYSRSMCWAKAGDYDDGDCYYG